MYRKLFAGSLKVYDLVEMDGMVLYEDPENAVEGLRHKHDFDGGKDDSSMC